MGNSFRLDDLLGKDTTEKKPPRRKGAEQDQGFALDDLLGPDTTEAAPAPEAPSAPAPDTGNVDLGASPSRGRAPVSVTVAAPARGRGIADRIAETLGGIGATSARAAQGASPITGLYGETRETRRMVPVPDRETAAQKLARTRSVLGETIGQRPDQTRAPATGSAGTFSDPSLNGGAPLATREGNLASDAEQEAVRSGIAADEQRKARFSPKAWRGIAKRGMDLANKLHAEGKHDEAEDVSKKAYNAQLLADGADDADTFGAIALSSLLGVFADPYEGQRRNMADAARGGMVAESDAEQKELGLNATVPTTRGFEAGKDLGAPLLGSLPLYAAGSMLGRGAMGLAGEALATRAPRAAKIAQALSHEIESVGIVGPKQAGLAGAKEAAVNLGQNAGRLATRGAVEGQIIGAAQAARAAQDVGDDPLAAAAESALMNVAIGAPAEVLLGTLSRMSGVAGRTIARTKIGQRLEADWAADLAHLNARFVGNAEGPKTIEMPVDPKLAGAMETARDVEGKTPIGDMTPEGQHRTIAEALNEVLDQKLAAENFGSDVGLVERDRSYLNPREVADENVPLRSARDVGLERAGVEPVARPSDEANAVNQMFRAAEEARAQQEAVARDAEQARIEQAAAVAAREKQGPLPLSTTIMRAGKEAEAGEPLAIEYKDAINSFADVNARMQDAGAQPGEKLKVDYARARAKLNEMRRKYGVQAGAAVLASIAAADDDLTDDERKMVGLGALAAGATGVVKYIPKTLASRAIEVATEKAGSALTRDGWMQALEREGVALGAHYDAISNAMRRVSPDESVLTHTQFIEAVRQATEGDSEPPSMSVGFYSRLKRHVERLGKQQGENGAWTGGRAWDAPRPVADWIGKLKGGGNFSKTELDLILPTLELAKGEKTKLSRADVLGLLDDKLPQIERRSLYREHGQSFNDYEERDVEQLVGADRPTIEREISRRETIRDDLQRAIDEETEEYRQTLERRENDLSEARSRVLDHVREHFPNLSESSVREAMDHVSEKTRDYGSLRERDLSDAMNTLYEDGGIDYADEPKPYDEQNIESEEISDDDGNTTGYKLTADDGTEVEAPTVWEALAKLEAEGRYESGSTRTLLPDNIEYTQELPASNQRWKVVAEDGSEFRTSTIGIERSALSDDEIKARLTEHFRALYPDRRFTFEPVDRDIKPESERHWVAVWRDDDGLSGRTKGEAGGTREALVEKIVDHRFMARADSSDVDRIREYLHDYGYETLRYDEAESDLNYREEGERFDDERRTIDGIEEEIEKLHALARDADERERAGVPAPVEEGTDPYLAPFKPVAAGDPRYEQTQSIGGGRNHRELLNILANHDGDLYNQGHYGSDEPGLQVHARVEDHVMETTPGLTGPTVEYPEGETGEAKRIRDEIKDVRRRRDIEDQKLDDIVRRYDALPEVERDPNNPSQAARNLAMEYRDVNNNVTNLGVRETELSRNLRIAIGHNTESEPIAILFELQSDMAQQAGREGVKTPIDDAERARLQGEYTRLSDEVNRVQRQRTDLAEERRQLNHKLTAERSKLVNDLSQYGSFHEHGVKEGPELEYHDLRNREAAIWDAFPDPRTVSSMIADMREAGQGEEFDWSQMERVSPELTEMYREYIASGDLYRELDVQQQRLHQQYQQVNVRLYGNSAQVPPTPFITGGLKQNPVTKRWDADGAAAFRLGAARFLIDSAERGYGKIGWSTSGNRIRKASLKFKAARLTYDELLPSTVKSLLGSLGFKDVEIKQTYIRGEGHWYIDFTPEMRKAIRKYGLPMLGVLAMTATPDSAEAQSTDLGAEPSRVPLYATAMGGVAAGALLMAMANNKKLRRLVAENLELRTALMRDDMSGLANKTAHGRAVPSVDADPHTAWIAFDGDNFKTLNDTHGHPEGDKAIMHFGRVIRDAAERNGIPMRGFRAGGDEFAIAVPKEKAADVLRFVEENSEYTKAGVTTKLTGSIGDAWAEADALLNQTKEANRAANPALARIRVRPDVDKALTEEITRALDTGMKLYSNPIGPALKELRKYPSAAAVGLIGYAMGESDNENIKRAGLPVMALAALSAIGSERLVAGKDALGSKLVNALRKTPEGLKTVRFFNPDALLHPDVRDAIVRYEREAAQGKARAVEFSGKAKKLGPEGDRAVSDVIEDEQWEDTAKMNTQQTTDVLSVAAELADEYDRLTREQVNAGVLDQSQVVPNYGGPRRYAYFEALDALADSPSNLGKPGRRPRIAGVKQRTLDVPLREAETALKEAHASGDQARIEAAQDKLDEAKVVQLSQRVQLGEIREASYRAAQGIERAHHNIASAKLFDTIRNVPGSAHPEWEQAVDDLLAAKQMYKQATTQVDRDAAEVMQNSAAVTLDEITKKYRGRDGEYVSLPDSPALGVLRGAVVKRDIAHSLEGFGTPGVYGKMLRAWKELKTVFNPGTSIGNILSNVTALHMGEVPVWLQPYYLTEAVKDLRAYGEGTRALAEAGVLNVNSVNALGTGELGPDMRKEEGLEELLLTTRPETRDVLRQQGITEERLRGKQSRRRLKGMAVGATIGAAKAYDPENPEDAATGAAIGAGVGALFGGKHANWVRRLYDNEDNVARLAVFLRRRKLGDTPQQATEKAIASLGNFRSRSPALKMISSTVSPFVMYQAKAVPAFAKNVVDHPWKYLSLIAAWGAVNELGKEEQGEVPEVDIPVNQRKTYGYFFPGFTQLPFGDERGNRAAVDMARYTPMGGLTTGAPPGSLPEAFSDEGMALTTPGGPVIDAALRGSNVDPYTHDPLIKRDRPLKENVGKLANEAANFILPSALGIHAQRLHEDIQNADWTKFKNDLFGPAGIKPRYVRPGAVATDAAYTLRRSLADMKQELRRDLRANKDPDRVKVLTDRYMNRVATALANFKSRIGTVPDQELVDDFLTPDVSP